MQLRQDFGSTIKFSDQEIYVSDPPRKRLQKISIFLVLVIVSLGIVGFFIERDKRVKESYEDRLISSIHNWNEAKDLKSLNDRRSKELAQEVKIAVEEIKAQGVKDVRLDALARDIENFLPGISGEYKVGPRLVLDLSLLEKDFSVVSFAGNAEKAVVFDPGLGRVVSFDYEGKNVENIEVIDIAKSSNGNGRLVLVDRGIYIRDGQRIARVDSSDSTTVALSDGNWGEVVFLHGFGGNLYVGDRERVWKYTPSVSGGFGGGQDWLSQEEADFYRGSMLGAVGTAIDGSLWILGKSGEVAKLTQGKRDYFSLQNLEEPLSSPKFLYTRADLDNLYILDSGNKRVVVVDKSGNYKVQYLWDGFGEAQGMVVSEELRRMLVFLGNKVYSVELRYLD